MSRMANARGLLGNRVGVLLALAFGAAFIAPIVLMVSASLDPQFRYFVFPVPLVPSPAGLDHYENIVSGGEFWRWMLNTAIVSAATIAGRILVCSMAGYAFARGSFRGRSGLFWAMMVFFMVPVEATIVPIFLMVSGAGLADEYAGLVLPYLYYVFGIFIMRQFMRTIPMDYSDAARMDGANEWTVFWRIMLPMARPAVATLVVLSFVEVWNDFLFPLVVTQSASMRTATVGLATMVTGRSGEAGTIVAAATLVFLPTLLVYLLLQRYIVRGMSIGGLK